MPSSILKAATRSEWFAQGVTELRGYFSEAFSTGAPSGADTSDKLISTVKRLASELQTAGMPERDSLSVALACGNLIGAGDILRSIIDFFKAHPALLSQTAAYRLLYVDGERLGGDALAIEVLGAYAHQISNAQSFRAGFSTSALLLVSEGVIRELAQLFVALRTGEAAIGAKGVAPAIIEDWEQRLGRVLLANASVRELLGEASEQVEELCRDLGILKAA